jgi:hypothetical protein
LIGRICHNEFGNGNSKILTCLFRLLSVAGRDGILGPLGSACEEQRQSLGGVRNISRLYLAIVIS